MWRSRSICNVFEEMRTAHKNHNYSYIESLIEEAQTMANRMEAKLEENKEIENLEERWQKAKKKDKYLRNILTEWEEDNE